MIQNSIESLLVKAQKAKTLLLKATDEQIERTLVDLANILVESKAVMLKANMADMSKLDDDNPRNDRLLLNKQRILNIAEAIRKIATLPNPTGKILSKRKLENGLKLTKKTVPLGVVGAIYESRPNVTFDIAALCLRSQNVCVLKGSREAANSNHAAVMLIKRALRNNGLPADAVILLPSERFVVDQLLTATKYIDVLIPRGSAGLIDYVRDNSKVPVIETGAGVCHTYVHETADLDMAVDIVINAKVSRPSVCNSLDVVLVDKKVSPEFLKNLSAKILPFGVGLFADKPAYKLLKGYPYLNVATAADYDREFLSLNASVKIVENMQKALDHIALHSTKHSEAIIAKDKKAIEQFLDEVDAAAVYSNASTRFTDGEEFGLGAEIGISTQKLHARGPFALEKLVTEKWIIQGTGQTRG